MARWSAVPAGTYAIAVHAGTWQLPQGGKDLALVPSLRPAVIAGPVVALPDVRFERPLRVTVEATAAQPPVLRWSAARGASRYRVAVRVHDGIDARMSSVDEAGSGAIPIDPGVVWWRDALAVTAVRIDPSGFVGPPGSVRDGLHEGTPYNVYVEATNGIGAPLATSEVLAGREPIQIPEWTALDPPASERGAFGQALSAEPRRVSARGLGFARSAPGPESFDQPPKEYDSPFFHAIALAGSRPNGNALRIFRERLLRERAAAARMPHVASPGQGLPPRRPLAGRLEPRSAS
jgi:hypothetical protein